MSNEREGVDDEDIPETDFSNAVRGKYYERAAGKRPIDLAKGDFVVPDDFDDPLPEDVLKLFEGDE